jgi:hypothetical protein
VAASRREPRPPFRGRAISHEAKAGETEQHHRPGRGLWRGEEVHPVRRVDVEERRFDDPGAWVHSRHLIETAKRDDRRADGEPGDINLVDHVAGSAGDEQPAGRRVRENHVVHPVDVDARLVGDANVGHCLLRRPRIADQRVAAVAGRPVGPQAVAFRRQHQVAVRRALEAVDIGRVLTGIGE